MNTHHSSPPHGGFTFAQGNKHPREEFNGNAAADVRLMSREEAYRRFAKECVEMARSIKDERTRAILLQMAQVWARLAEEKADATSDEPD